MDGSKLPTSGSTSWIEAHHHLGMAELDGTFEIIQSNPCSRRPPVGDSNSQPQAPQTDISTTGDLCMHKAKLLSCGVNLLIVNKVMAAHDQAGDSNPGFGTPLAPAATPSCYRSPCRLLYHCTKMN